MTNSELDLSFAKPLISNYTTIYICKQLPKVTPLVRPEPAQLKLLVRGQVANRGEKPDEESKKWYAQFFWTG